MRSLFAFFWLAISINCVDSAIEQSCTTHYTGWERSDQGNVVFLDRQRVNCGQEGKSMSGFQMQSQDRGDNVYIRYRYTCCSFNRKYCGFDKKRFTAFNSDGGGNAVYLDRHRVDCGSKGLINEFWLRRNGAGNQMRYEFYCCNANHYKVNCYSEYTSCLTYDGEGKNYYLDRQSVQCKDGYSLSAFRLYRNSAGDSWRYWYRCCSIQG